jgi:uracil-DNA glycosylase
LPQPLNGDLNTWRKEGVLLLNTALSVRQGKPGSHKNKGWEIFTSNLITYVVAKSDNAGFICFGQPAHKLAKKVTKGFNKKDVTIIHTPHPSPLSAHRGFFGSKPFTTFNNIQSKKGKEIVHWELPSNGQKSLF